MANNGYKWWWDFLSRKFLVLAIATSMLWFGKVSDDIWLYVALAYIGTNVVQKFLEGKNGIPAGTPYSERREVTERQVGVAPGEQP